MSTQVALFIFSLLAAVAFTAKASVLDFCVANPSFPMGPAGYSCKNPAQAVDDDFSFDLSNKGDTSNLFGSAITPAVAPIFPGVNGLGISMARVDFAKGGVQPFHIHRGATEVIVVIQGTIEAGFVSSVDNKVYLKTLRRGGIMVFPRGLLHFQINVGKSPALVFASFNSEMPGLQYASTALFGNSLPTETVVNATFIDGREVQRLKRLPWPVAGGTN